MARAAQVVTAQSPEDGELKDLLAFILLALESVVSSAQATAEAWEKRGYWLKADRFRAEWAWAEDGHGALAAALQTHDWEAARATVSRILAKTQLHDAVARRDRSRNPWEGAWDRWVSRGNR
jgi:hypothetical protein